MTSPGSEDPARIARLNRVSDRALQVFGNLVMAFHWLRTPNRALSGAVPLTLLDSDTGAARVIDRLARIERGEATE